MKLLTTRFLSVTVSVTGEPMYNSTNGIFSAVILSTTGHICQ